MSPGGFLSVVAGCSWAETGLPVVASDRANPHAVVAASVKTRRTFGLPCMAAFILAAFADSKLSNNAIEKGVRSTRGPADRSGSENLDHWMLATDPFPSVVDLWLHSHLFLIDGSVWHSSS